MDLLINVRDSIQSVIMVETDLIFVVVVKQKIFFNGTSGILKQISNIIFYILDYTHNCQLIFEFVVTYKIIRLNSIESQPKKIVVVLLVVVVVKIVGHRNLTFKFWQKLGQ